MDGVTGRIGGVIPGRQEQCTLANWHSGANKVMRPEIHPQTASNSRGVVNGAVILVVYRRETAVRSVQVAALSS